MNMLERSIMLGLSLLLIIISLPYMMFKELYPLVSQAQMIVNVILGTFIGLYNFLFIYKRATTLVIVDFVDLDNIENFEKGVKEDD